jgi:hypothetical protein
VRITDIVNQNAARAAAGQRVSQRLSEQREAQRAAALEELQTSQAAQEIQETQSRQRARFAEMANVPDDAAIFPADEGEDPLGAIVERFVRQRSIMQITLPFAYGGGSEGVGQIFGQGRNASQSGMFNLTLEVEETYRVIEFIPRSQWVGQGGDGGVGGIVDVQA